MKSTLRVLCLWLVSIMVLSAGTGCERNPRDLSDMSRVKQDEKTVLHFMYWDRNQKPGMDKIIQAFEKENPDITIESLIVTTVEYRAKLLATLQAGSGPDIFWISRAYTYEFAPKGLLFDVQKYIERDKIDLSVFKSDLQQLYTYKGRIFGIAKDFDTIALFYNKELFDKSHVPYPNGSWTWDDLLKAAQKLTIRDTKGNVLQYGFYAEDDKQDCQYNFMLQNNGRIMNDTGTKFVVNIPENVEAAQFLVDLMYKYKVSPDGKLQQTIDMDSFFTSGRVAMLGNGSWMVGPYFQKMREKVRVAPMPMGKTRACMMNSLAFAAASKTKYPEEVWKFLKFCATKEAAELQSEVVIPAYSGAQKKWIDRYPTMNLQVFIDAMEYAQPVPFSGRKPFLSMSPLTFELTKLWRNEKTAAQAISDAEREMNEEINR